MKSALYQESRYSRRPCLSYPALGGTRPLLLIRYATLEHSRATLIKGRPIAVSVNDFPVSGDDDAGGLASRNATLWDAVSAYTSAETRGCAGPADISTALQLRRSGATHILPDVMPFRNPVPSSPIGRQPRQTTNAARFAFTPQGSVSSTRARRITMRTVELHP